MSSQPSAKAVELVNEYFYSVVCDEQQRARLLKYDAPAMKAAHAALLAHIADLERRVAEAEAVCLGADALLRVDRGLRDGTQAELVTLRALATWRAGRKGAAK